MRSNLCDKPLLRRIPRVWHLFFLGVYRGYHKCEARALRSRAIFEDINVDVQNTRSPSLLERSGTFYVTDMTKSSGYRMNCEAIYAIRRCCAEARALRSRAIFEDKADSLDSPPKTS